MNPASPANTTLPVLRLEGICLSFPHCELFDHLTARVPPGVTLVRGGESRGKTSLLRIVAGDLGADAGSVWVNDVELEASREKREHQVFWVSPRTDAFDALSAADFIHKMRLLYVRFDDVLLLELIDGLLIAPHLEKKLFMLSTGSRRKVWLAAALASGAPVTLLDEPFAALDAPSIACVKRALTQFAGQSLRTILISDYEAPSGLPLASTIDLGA